jgi:hypothetical protein
MGYGYHDHEGSICDPGCPMWSRRPSSMFSPPRCGHCGQEGCTLTHGQDPPPRQYGPTVWPETER